MPRGAKGIYLLENVVRMTCVNEHLDSGMEANKNIQWFAMSATFGRELKAKDIIEEKNVECFVPMRYEIHKDKKQKSTRKLVSAISNLIFVHTTRKDLQELKAKIPYLHYLTQSVDGRNVPITVPDYQMQHFIATCNTFNEKLVYLAPDEINLQEGTPVRIVGGAFDGIEAIFVRIEKGKRKKVVVMIEGIAAVAVTKFDDGYIQLLDN